MRRPVCCPGPHLTLYSVGSLGVDTNGVPLAKHSFLDQRLLFNPASSCCESHELQSNLGHKGISSGHRLSQRWQLGVNSTAKPEYNDAIQPKVLQTLRPQLSPPSHQMHPLGCSCVMRGYIWVYHPSLWCRRGTCYHMGKPASSGCTYVNFSQAYLASASGGLDPLLFLLRVLHVITLLIHCPVILHLHASRSACWAVTVSRVSLPLCFDVEEDIRPSTYQRKWRCCHYHRQQQNKAADLDARRETLP
jgi:hypothetical protein